MSHLRGLVNESEYDLVELYLAAAEAAIQTLRGEVFLTQTWEWEVGPFPSGVSPIVLPIKPVQSIEAISYVDTAGVTQTFGTLSGSPPTTEEYRLVRDPERPRVELQPNEYWPTDAFTGLGPTIRFVAGYGDPEDVPALYKSGILLLTGHFYANRETVVVGDSSQQAAEIPWTIRELLGVPRIG